MAGTLFGLGLMPQFDTSGVIARGALLYLYNANTSTPVTSYSDFALTSAQQWPLVADGGGRLPAFWLSDGSYRARLTTSAGVTIFDEQSITAIGSSSGSSSSSSQDTTTLFQTGHMLFDPVRSSLSGFVRANGLTMGNGSSGGTERANSDTQSLFEFLWSNYDDTACPVSTGRGASSTADFNANKTITLPDWRDCVPIGRSGMGNTTTGLISDTLAASVGATTRTIAQANLPSYNLSLASLTGSVSTGITNGGNLWSGNSGNTFTASDGAGRSTVPYQVSNVAASLASGAVTFGGSIPSGGSGTALSTIPKGRVGNWWIKL